MHHVICCLFQSEKTKLKKNKLQIFHLHHTPKARMAAAKNIPCTPHISGSGLGYFYMMQFVSAVANAGPYHEFKGFNKSIPFQCDTSDFKIVDDKNKVPRGPGMGIELDQKFLRNAKQV